ncbi:MAG: DUF3108 domain-containing protein [Burkholderiales bacterium]|nr:DUF3108 domain-containing protein [Burkholderiales bacterium]
MSAAQPSARKPLVLLTLGVLAAHMVLLHAAPQYEPPRPPGMRPLQLRTVDAPPSQAPEAVVEKPVPAVSSEEKRPAERIQQAQSAIKTVAIADLVVVAPAVPAEPVVTAAAAPAPSARDSSLNAVAFAVAPPARLRYAITGTARGLTWHADGELQWRHDGSSYDAQLSYAIPLIASRSQRSTGRITSEGLAPSRFSDKSRSEQAAHFERDKGKVTFSSNAPDAELAAGAQDRLSVLLQLGAMIAAAPAKFPAGSSITLQTVGTRDAEPWLFTVEADETLQLPGGNVPARKLVRVPRRDYDVKVELWLGTRMDYVPVRVRLTQANGDYVDQQWSSTDRR